MSGTTTNTLTPAKPSNWYLLRRVFGLTRPYRFLFTAAVVLSLISAPVAILRPYLVQYTVDAHILQRDEAGLLFIIQLLFGVLLLEGILAYIFTYTTNLLGQSIICDLRVRTYRHINYQRLSYFDKTPVGVNITRTINDMETINTVFSEGIITIVSDILTLIVVFVMMLLVSWKLTLVCMTIFPLLLISSYWFKNAVKRSYEEIRNQVAKLNTFLQERVSGMRIVQIFNAEAQEAEKFERINHDYTKASLNGIFAYALFFPIVEILSAAALGIMVWYGAGAALEGTASVGVLIAFPLYLGMLFRPIRMLADKFNSLQMGLIAANRVFELLDSTNQIQNSGTYAPEHLRGDIVFDNVYFSYEQDKKAEDIKDWTLSGVSFAIPASQTLAIVGSTGAGKSTIISILNRFYDIHKGKISIDGRDLQDFDIFALRRRIAIVLQDVFLFSGTVLDNIRLNDESISRQTVIDAAKMIGADEFIQRLPDNYDYEVRERGATLSMGQRQLISFVRALVFNPDVLILDEATSAIDPETEAIIQNAIHTLIKERTSIIIAHRLSTIQHAQQIMVMEKGEVSEIGSHQELMQRTDGHYRQLIEAAYVN
jgi:ATP-binding cassette, subfamily B, multidrug efflux pump